MVLDVDTREENWNSLQSRLSNNRTKKLNNTKKGYEKIHSNRLNAKNTNSSTTPDTLNRGLPTNRSNNSYKMNFQKNNALNNINNNNNNNKSKNTNNNNRSYSPLRTPVNYRNNSGKTNNDPYGINPLPNIKSPYVSSRDQFQPNLESWGVSNQPLYDNFNYRQATSPFLPTYYSLTRTRNPYGMAPSFRRTLYQVPSPIMADISTYDRNPRLNFINEIPYNRPAFDSNPALKQENHNEQLKSEEFIKRAQTLLKLTEKKSSEDENELFSTKFLDELEYKMPDKKPSNNKKVPPKKKVQIRESKKDPIAEEYIQSIKDEVDQMMLKNNVNQYVEPVEAPKPVNYNNHAIDVAENIYKKEIETLIRQMAENAIDEEYNMKMDLQKPIFNEVVNSTINKMAQEIAKEVLADHQRQVQILQSHEVKKVAKEKLVNNLLLDHMLDTVAQHGKVVAENDEVGILLDTTVLDVLLNTYNDVKKNKEKTLNNYPLKKFHLNSVMNVALDILVSELSTSLEEDIKDLDEIEKKLNK